jgi:hypothetical protein
MICPRRRYSCNPGTPIVGFAFALRVDRVSYDSGNSFYVIEAHVRRARKLDQVSPDALSMGKSIPNAFVEIGQEVNRYITPLNFVTGAAESFDHVRSQVGTRSVGQNARDLR